MAFCYRRVGLTQTVEVGARRQRALKRWVNTYSELVKQIEQDNEATVQAARVTHEQDLAGRRARNTQRRREAQEAFEVAMEEFEAKGMASYHARLAQWEQHKAQLMDEATRVRE